MMEVVLRTEAFYFSYTYDITHTFQRLQTSPPDFHSTPFIDRADQRFVWNRYLLSHLTNSNRAAARFALPLLHGCKFSNLRVRSIFDTFLFSHFSSHAEYRWKVVCLRRDLAAKHLPSGYKVMFDSAVEIESRMVGCRLFIRGIDEDGRVANFVETEQILQLADVSCSYVQVQID